MRNRRTPGVASAGFTVLLLVLGAAPVLAGNTAGPVGEPFAANDVDPGPSFLFSYFAENEIDWCRSNGNSLLAVRPVPLPQTGRDPVEVIVQRYDALGHEIGESLHANLRPARYLPQIACNPVGDFVVSWSDQQSSQRLLRVFARDGKPLSEPFGVPGWEAGDLGCRSFAVTLTSSRSVVAACVASSELQQNGVQVRVFAGDGQLLRQHDSILEIDTSYANLISLAGDDSGNALILAAGRARLMTDVDEGGRTLGPAFDTDGYLARHEPGDGPGRFRAMWPDFSRGGWLARWLSVDGTAPSAPRVAEPAEAGHFRQHSQAWPTRSVSRWTESEPPRIAASRRSWVLAHFDSYLDGSNARGSAVSITRSSDDGRSWSAPRGVSVEWAGGFPDIASDGKSRFVTVWQTDDEYLSHVLASSSDDDGETWSEQVVVAESQANDHQCGSQRSGPAAVASDGRGTWIVVWGTRAITNDCSERRISYADQLLASRSVDGGLSWQDPVSVAFDHGIGLRGIDVVFDDRGGWNVTWVDDAVRSSRSADGRSWSTPADLTVPDPFRTMRSDAESFFLEDGRSGYGVAGPGRGVSIASRGDGSLLIAAASAHVDEGHYGRDSDVFAWSSGDGGSTWSGAAAVARHASIDGATDDWPSVTADHRGRWVVAWRSFLGGLDTEGLGLEGDVLITESGDGRNWSAPAVINRSAGSDSDRDGPASLVSRDGITLAAWARVSEQEPLAEYASDLSIRVAVAGDQCGDGKVDPREACDDGDAVEGDACDSNCTLPACGNGIADNGEECDDGNSGDDDSCTAECNASRCGDGSRWVGREQCDDANESNTDECLTTCVLASCGDGFVQTGVEVCDHAGDGTGECTWTCRLPSCPDGIVNQPSEECDDGDTDSTDNCTPQCTLARCGDGYWRAGTEQCDYGVVEQSDFCTTDCTIAVCPDADGNSTVAASDAFLILRRAVGLSVYCPMTACDANSDRKISAADASLTLENSVGLQSERICQPPRVGEFSITIVDPRSLGAAQLEIRYPLTFDIFDDPESEFPRCVSELGNTLTAFHSEPGLLTAGVISREGFSGVYELFHCEYFGITPGPASAFQATWIDVTDIGGVQLVPPPQVFLQLR